MSKSLTLTAPATRRPATPSLIWAVLAGELGLALALFQTHLLPEIAVRGLRLFLRF
jgi:hypothetical protein